jgi:CSLREA domain-containing protein
MKIDRRKLNVAGVVGIILVAALLLLIPERVLAATITVTTLDDPTGPAGTCALRDAITAANTMTATNNCAAGTGTDTINFSVSGTIDLGSTLPTIKNSSPHSLTIDGTGQSITISGQNLYEVMVVQAATLNLANLTIANGNNDNGGGLDNEGGGTVTVTNCTFSDNQGEAGGAINNEATMSVTNSTFINNSAPGNGGGGIFDDGTLTVTNSTFTGNSAPNGGNGGGILVNVSLTVTNSTFSGNSASGTYSFGGAIAIINGTGTATNSTFTNNSVSGSNSFGGGIANVGNPFTLKGTLLADEPSGGNCAVEGATIADGGYNLSDDASCNFSAMTSQNSVSDAMLNLDIDGLENNGGPTETIALESPSVAIDQIPLTLCTDANGDPLTTDQRGYGRPAPAPQQSLCDIGAYEFGAVPTPTPTPSPTPTPTPTPRPTPTPTPTPTPGPVTITSPAAGSTVSGVVTVACTNPYGPANLYIDGTFVGYYTYSWNTAKFTNGSHYLLCNGYRNGSMIGSAAEHVTVSNGAPTPTPKPTPTPTPTATPTPRPTPTPTPTPGAVTITSPAAGSTVSTTVSFSCTTPGGTSNLYIDDTFVGYSPYSWNTTKFTNGSHYLLCNGYRNKVMVGSAAEYVTVRN